MLSDDFAYAWQTRREWDDFYDQEIVNPEIMYKTLFFTYKGRYYQYEPVGQKKGQVLNGKLVKYDSYIFISADSWDEFNAAYAHAQCYDNFKDAVDHAEIVPGKKLKDLWDDPDTELLAFS